MDWTLYELQSCAYRAPVLRNCFCRRGVFRGVGPEPAPLTTPKEPEFEMPNSGKPINLVFFEKIATENTEQRTLDMLTEALVKHMQEFEEYDTAKAVPVIKKLDEMTTEDRENCIYTPGCIAGIGRELGVANIVIGKIQTENLPRPKISLDLIETNTATMKNFIEFETQPRLGTQERDLKPAVYSLYGKKIAEVSDLIHADAATMDNSLPLAQLISGIAVGVVGLAAVGVGIKFGLDAKNADEKVKKAINANKNVLKNKSFAEYDTLAGKRQSNAKKFKDDAKRNAMIANILYATGGVAAAVSLILFLVHPDSTADTPYAQSEPYITPGITDDGAGVFAGFRF